MKKDRCDSCVYKNASNDAFKLYKCNYFGITGHTRLAQPIEQCTFYERDKGLRPKRASSISGKEESMRMLYNRGMLDPEIGKIVGVSAQAVGNWRRRSGLLNNRKGLATAVEGTPLWAVVMGLYRSGKPDGDIGKELGFSSDTVRNWRKRNKLPGHKRGKAQ